MASSANICQNIVVFFHYLQNDLASMYIYICDKDLTTVSKVSPVLYNVCIAMKLP